MLQGLIHMHSGLRWVVLTLLLVSIFNSFMKKRSGDFGAGDQKLALFAMIATHLQLVIGLLLYFMSPKVVFSGDAMGNSILRFYLVEHILMMLVAVALITVGYKKAKRAGEDAKKFKAIAVFFLIGLLVMIAAIPWPFRNLGGAWF